MSDEAHPPKVFFVKDVGRHRDRLHSFELALRDAGIERLNPVPVSSILPPGCEIVSPASAMGVPDDKVHRERMLTQSIAQSAVVEAGRSTTVIAAAVFVL